MYFLLKMGIFHCYVSLPEGMMGMLVLGRVSTGELLARRYQLVKPSIHQIINNPGCQGLRVYPPQGRLLTAR